MNIWCNLHTSSKFAHTPPPKHRDTHLGGLQQLLHEISDCWRLPFLTTAMGTPSGSPHQSFYQTTQHGIHESCGCVCGPVVEFLIQTYKCTTFFRIFIMYLHKIISTLYEIARFGLLEISTAETNKALVMRKKFKPPTLQNENLFWEIFRKFLVCFSLGITNTMFQLIQ